jgi:ferredoxin
MCEFCIKHGEGRKWYLQMKNYSSQLALRAKGILRDFIRSPQKELLKELGILERINRLPLLLRNILRGMIIKRQKRRHFGQILPLEDAKLVISMAGSVTLLPCLCRKITTAREERFCMGLGMDLLGIQTDSPGRIEKYEAHQLLEEFDKRGLFHSVWTFGTPFIGAICNCDLDCLAYRTRLQAGLGIFFKSEYICKIDQARCTGCRDCRKNCHFGAIEFSASLGRCRIRQEICYGCGLCRSICPQGAITLTERISLPGLRKNW